MYLTFEEAVELASDVVVAEFVAHRPFGQSLTEYEFVVHERIFGNAADRIFVYEQNNTSISVVGMDISYEVTGRPFNTGTEYLLLLEMIDPIYANTHEDGFLFLTNIKLDLNAPSTSTMYDEPLTQHSTGMNFNSRSLTRERIVSYVYELTRNNTPARERIMSEDIEDIIKGSPYVLVVEIGEPRRLSHEGASTDWRSTDIYNTNVVRVLKGEMEVGDLVRMVFFADTVQTGEQHIIAIEPRDPDDPYFYGFTTRNSLFGMEELDEILLILGYQPEEPEELEEPDESETPEQPDYPDSPNELVESSPRELRNMLEDGDVMLATPGNLGIFAEHSPFVVPEGRTLYIETTLNIQRDAELIVEGAIVVLDGGRLNNQGSSAGGGTITIAEGGRLVNNGHVENVSNSRVLNNGMIINNSRFEVRANTVFINEGVVDEASPLNIHRDAIRE